MDTLNPTKLTKAQRTVLEAIHSRGTTSTHSGRGGWSRKTMEALVRLGFFRKGKDYTWETDWHLTDSGEQMAAQCHAEWLANLNRG
jgi:hypothetical protein